MGAILVRLLAHGTLVLLWIVTAWAALIWPHTIALAGLENSLAVQAERQLALEDEIETLRALNGQLVEWKSQRSTVLPADELPAYLDRLRQGLRRAGVAVRALGVRAETDPRWLAVARASWSESTEDPEAAPYVVQPVRMHLVATGRFPQIYRGATLLTLPRPLAVLNRWSLQPVGSRESGELRAEFVMTLFLIASAATATTDGPGAAASDAPLASRPGAEAEG